MLPSAGFDFIECAQRAYIHAWTHRRDVMHLCLAVIVFKIMSFAGIMLLDMDAYKLRQGLLLMPSYFLEGWVISLILIAAVRGQGAIPMGSDNTKRNGIAGAIVYTLIKLVMAFLTGMTLEGEMAAPAAEQNPEPLALLIATVMIAVMVMGFRFLWLYVPIALGYRLQDYVQAFKSVTSALAMIGIWLLCFVPFGMVMVLALGLIDALTGGEGLLYMNLVGAAQAVIDFGMSLVCSLGVGFAVQKVMREARAS